MREMLTGFMIIVVLLFSGCSSKRKMIKKTVVKMQPTWIKDQNGCKAWNPSPVQNETVTWTGTCKDGKIDGFGTFIWYENGKVNQKYIGEYKKGRVHGRGTMTWTSLNKIVGERWRGKVENKYTGQWKNDEKNGHGELIIKTPIIGGIKTDKHIGEFKDNKKHGKGIRIYQDGVYSFTKRKRIDKIVKAIGEWKYGKRHGLMKRIYQDGRYTIVEWKNGKKVRHAHFYANGKPYKRRHSTIFSMNDILTGAALTYVGLMAYGTYKAITDDRTYSDDELANMKKEQERYDSTPNDAYIILSDNREDYSFKNVKIKCLKSQEEFLINYDPDSKEPPYGRSSHILNWSRKRFYTLDESARYICKGLD